MQMHRNNLNLNPLPMGVGAIPIVLLIAFICRVPAFGNSLPDAAIADLREQTIEPAAPSSAIESRPLENGEQSARQREAPELAAAEPARPSVLDAIVGISTRVSDDARSAREYGTRRRGSGVVIDANGLIATIGYLVAEASEVEVSFADGRSAPARVIAYDHASGLALLRAVGVSDTEAMPMGNSAGVKAKDKLLIVGASGDQQPQAVTAGKIKKFAGGWGYVVDDALFTYPPSTAFSGAALVSAKGELVGIGALVSIDIDIDPKVRVPGNVFVPINALTSVLGELMVAGKPVASEKPWVGIHTRKGTDGLTVGQVAPGGPAAQAGIAAGDKIVAVDQKRVTGLADFYAKLWHERNPGDQVHLLIIRDNRYANVAVQTINPYDWLKVAQEATQLTELDD